MQLQAAAGQQAGPGEQCEQPAAQDRAGHGGRDGQQQRVSQAPDGQLAAGSTARGQQCHLGLAGHHQQPDRDRDRRARDDQQDEQADEQLRAGYDHRGGQLAQQPGQPGADRRAAQGIGAGQAIHRAAEPVGQPGQAGRVQAAEVGLRPEPGRLDRYLARGQHGRTDDQRAEQDWPAVLLEPGGGDRAERPVPAAWLPTGEGAAHPSGDGDPVGHAAQREQVPSGQVQPPGGRGRQAGGQRRGAAGRARRTCATGRAPGAVAGHPGRPVAGEQRGVPGQRGQCDELRLGAPAAGQAKE